MFFGVTLLKGVLLNQMWSAKWNQLGWGVSSGGWGCQDNRHQGSSSLPICITFFVSSILCVPRLKFWDEISLGEAGGIQYESNWTILSKFAFWTLLISTLNRSSFRMCDDIFSYLGFCCYVAIRIKVIWPRLNFIPQPKFFKWIARRRSFFMARGWFDILVLEGF